jgi:hypothetical protein
MSRISATRSRLVAAVQAAEETRSRGHWGEALEAYAEILRVRLEELRDAGTLDSAMQAIDLIVIERLADLAVLFGFLRPADRLLEGYIALTSAAGNLMAADYAALKRVHLALGYGQIHDAVEQLEQMAPSLGNIHLIRFESQALRRWEAECPWREFDDADQAVLYTRLYLELGRLMASVGQYEDALAALKRGLKHARPQSTDLARRALLPIQLDIAAVLIEKGNIHEARVQLDLASELVELSGAAETAVRRAELSGKLALLIGDLGSARGSLSDVLMKCRALGFRRAAVQAALNLAHLSIYLNQTAVACDLLNQAIAEAADQDDLHVQPRAEYLLRLARARGTSLADGVAITPPVARLWDSSPTVSAHVQVVSSAAAGALEAPQASNYLAFFEDQALEFHARLASEGPRSGADQLERMRAIFAATDSELIHLRLRNLAGFSAYYLEQYTDAAELLEGTVARLTALGLRPELWQVLRFLRWARIRMGRTGFEVMALTEQAQGLLDGMVGSLAPEDRPIFSLNKWTTQEEFLAAQIDLLSRDRARLALSPWPLRLWRRWALWRRLDELLRFVDQSRAMGHFRHVHHTEEPTDTRVSAAPSLWRRMLLHPRRRAILTFLVLPDRVFLACSSWFSLDFCVSPVTRLDLREKVGQWHKAIGKSVTAATDADRVAEEVVTVLQLHALLDRLPRHVNALTIIPDDSLYGFPFSAIIYHGAYLIERFALSVGLERVRHWRAAPQSKTARRADSPTKALLVGVSRGSDTITPLPGVRSELDVLARWLAARCIDTSRIENDEADKASVLDGLCRCLIAHLACHGVFDLDRPDASGLVLLPTSDHMDILSIHDLARTDLSNLKHVTLSACWTADTFVLPGRQVISLPETLYRAGVRSVLASLWPVDDAIAVALMGRFYDYLDIHPRDEALRRAQLDCIRGKLFADSDPFTSHPVAWAGFTLTGDPGRLRI